MIGQGSQFPQLGENPSRAEGMRWGEGSGNSKAGRSSGCFRLFPRGGEKKAQLGDGIVTKFGVLWQLIEHGAH